MMRKYVSRLLALVLVLCMVVLCVPVRACATEIARPEGMTDAEWEAYLLKRKQMLAAADAEVAADTGTAVTPADATVPKQSVTVEVPVDKGAVVEDNNATTTETVPDTSPQETVSVTDTYEVEAKITEVEATEESTAETTVEKITEMEYEISMNKTTKETDEDGHTTTTTTDDADLAAKAAAEAAKTPAPQYKVEMTANGMNAKEITRVTHTKKPTTPGTPPAEDAEEPEYFYNAANGTADTNKKYFTVTEVEKDEDDGKGGIKKVKDTVISLWTSFLGIFNITTDAFEGTAKDSDGIVKTYASLSEAQADTNSEIDMLRDYTTDSSAALSQNTILDLNGHTYTNTGTDTALNVSGQDVTVKDGNIISGGTGVSVDSTNKTFSLKNLFLKSNADKKAEADTAGLKVNASGNTTTVDNSTINGANSRYGIQYTGDAAKKDTLNVRSSDVVGGTGVEITDANANIAGSYVAGTAKAQKGTDAGAAVAVSQAVGTKNSVVISSGLFDSAREIENIYAADKASMNSITVSGGRFTDPDDLYCYIAPAHAVISHNDGTYFLYEVVGTDYVPTRDGYRFLGYVDAKGNAITLAEAYRRGVIAYAQWKEIPETAAKQVPLITVKTDEKDCTTKVSIKGDTAYVTVKDKDGDFAPISEVIIPSVKRLRNKEIDTVEIQVDEDVTLVLDVEEAKKNGFTDTVEVTLEKDTLLITSGKDTCIELDIAVLKASDKPVEIQLVEGELTVMLGKNSSLSVDLTKALKTGERIVVKLENGVLKLYDKYNKPLKED